MQPNVKSFMKFWSRPMPAELPGPDWYGELSDTGSDAVGTTTEAAAAANDATGEVVFGAPRAISVAGISDVQFTDSADGWAHALPVARMPMPEDTPGSQELARIQPAARSAPWWESADSAGAVSSLIAGQVDRLPAITMPLAWESVHSELMNQLTHTSESALGEPMPQDVWSTVGSSSVLSEGVDLRHLTAADDAQRVTGRVSQRLR
jgi:hypothetical protein